MIRIAARVIVATMVLFGLAMASRSVAPPAGAAVAAVPGVGVPFDCSSSTIYTVSWGSSQAISALNPATGDRDQRSPRSILRLGQPNALGITPDGTNAYYMDDEDASTVYDYNAVTKTVTPFQTGT